ncbi:glycosyltransferase [Microcoleus sp. FACHB-53]|nr:glycosyltransferase [Microcoleus sp. FACHB-53]
MSEQHAHRATIPPVPDDVSRPLWSVMIPAYNPGKYLRETLATLLAQAPGSDIMQIAVVDDRYPHEDLEAVVKEVGGERVEFYRQPENVGLTKNFQTCLQLARGRLIHVLHADDCVREGFYPKMQRLFSDHPEIGAAFCRHIITDENGHWQSISVLEQPESGVLPRSWLEHLAGFIRIQTPSIVVRRDIYEKLGGFDNRLPICSDWEMWVRIFTYYPMAYEAEPLALYRKHSKSITNKTVRDGRYFQQLREAVDIFHKYLPEEIADKVYKMARQNCAYHTLEIADSILEAGDMPVTLKLLGEAIKTSPTFRVIRSAGRIFLLDGSEWLLRIIYTALSGRGYKNAETPDTVLRSDA